MISPGRTRSFVTEGHFFLFIRTSVYAPRGFWGALDVVEFDPNLFILVWKIKNNYKHLYCFVHLYFQFYFWKEKLLKIFDGGKFF